ncbi:PDGLE domain-containing protein [Mycobacterium sp. AMU20-3851]|uniref:PDGLE domain-containing protein n=1 Tax=Mycobacterium sp. AMU20-3851 TaxID=3122055 RepID=UPI003754123A
MRFWAAALILTLLIAGGVSYLASANPDGLDSATLRGCEVTEIDGAEELTGNCIAQHADEHALAGSPLADYAVDGREHTGGLAGVIGVLVTLAAAGGLFRILT